ncbi:MAG: GMC family oxidoreductase [Candidatus Aminicenantes bacterium]|nr:GMC family oxidoreductase [Candidatus Aminicenantes bacterium]
MKTAIVVGSGAGGATVAKELQRRFRVKVLEAGKPFRAFSWNLEKLAKLKKAGIFMDEREIPLIFPAMRIQKTDDRMVLVKGICTGGTTTLSTGNALRLDRDLKKMGVDLDDEFAEIREEIFISSDHRHLWRQATEKLFKACQEMGLDPEPVPKMGHYERCANCGRCVLGCSHGVKWDSRQYLQTAVAKGVELITGCRVERVVIEGSLATGVLAQRGFRTAFFPADLVVLAAGGLGTPVILRNSGLECDSKLFVDPVLCVAAEWENCKQNQEIPMPFAVQKEHFMLSPYFDHLSFLFNRTWRYPAGNILSLMIKLSDSNQGSVSARKVKKTLTSKDRERLQDAVSLCRDILARLGVKPEKTFLGTVNAGHPGGTLALTQAEAGTLHKKQLPGNCYIADASLLPCSLGRPPILTIVALAKRVSKICCQVFGN